MPIRSLKPQKARCMRAVIFCNGYALGLQAANGSHEQDDRTSLQQEVIALQDELDRVAITTTFADKTSSMALMVLRVFILAPMRTLYH